MIGEIIQFAGTTIPEGCLVCNGAAVSRTEYSELFSVIGTTYGQGDGSTTFNIPDMLGRAALGVDSTYTAGSSGGASDVLLDSTQIPLHTHSIPAHTHSNTIAAETPTITHSITAQPSYTYTHLNGTGKRGIIGSGANHFTGTLPHRQPGTELHACREAPGACEPRRPQFRQQGGTGSYRWVRYG